MVPPLLLTAVIPAPHSLEVFRDKNGSQDFDREREKAFRPPFSKMKSPKCGSFGIESP